MRNSPTFDFFFLLFLYEAKIVLCPWVKELGRRDYNNVLKNTYFD